MGLRVRLLLAGMCLLGLAGVAPASADPTGDGPRLAQVRADLAESGVYLEAGPAAGEVDLWRERLESALAEADLGVPIKVGLWSEIADVPPSMYADPAETLTAVGAEDGVLIGSSGASLEVLHLQSGKRKVLIDAVLMGARAVVAPLVERSPDPDRFSQVSAVAQAWIYLRLASADPPEPKDLVDELAGDTSLLVDSAYPALRPDSWSPNDFRPLSVATMGLVVLGTCLMIVRRVRADHLAARRQEVADEVDPLAARLTPLMVEEELTDLAEAISTSDRVPGDPAYDKALAFADAANAHASSEDVRDLLGVHFLVADGVRALGGWSRESRCFFNPAHRGTTTLRRKQSVLPCCAACASAVRSGGRPDSLLLPDADGWVRAYYETDDIWTATGYGAVDERWARRVHLDALERR
ncbi:hypothetical protein BJ980_001252 [Nocardioides daedukensis]|uniref:Uncharacterized protein n=1 Tax=Nocardioides daedukensis TaxID=634462 RepID=A0A7Y9S244_9ACTN|nr:hypothetical protein [Nocardioides daedukensis]NYG58329.1 hypothetical protein [Nocardioides daedukensis]